MLVAVLVEMTAVQMVLMMVVQLEWMTADMLVLM